MVNESNIGSETSHDASQRAPIASHLMPPPPPRVIRPPLPCVVESYTEPYTPQSRTLVLDHGGRVACPLQTVVQRPAGAKTLKQPDGGESRRKEPTWESYFDTREHVNVPDRYVPEKCCAYMCYAYILQQHAHF
jgi:hypothetical protein